MVGYVEGDGLGSTEADISCQVSKGFIRLSIFQIGKRISFP